MLETLSQLLEPVKLIVYVDKPKITNSKMLNSNPIENARPEQTNKPNSPNIYLKD